MRGQARIIRRTAIRYVFNFLKYMTKNMAITLCPIELDSCKLKRCYNLNSMDLAPFYSTSQNMKICHGELCMGDRNLIACVNEGQV